MQDNSLEILHFLDKLKHIKAMVLDVDGVLTNNTIQVTEQGELLRTMHVRDGQAIKWAIQAGLQVGIITGGRSEGVKIRLTDLGISAYYSGMADKGPALDSFLHLNGLMANEIAYMGDDLPDLPVMRRVLLAACAADAVPEVVAISDYVSTYRGGEGCVRDLLEKILKLGDKWPRY
jgi:3-deoxy-D-manno-octulosonate 8-phosphate phosphatase (KDO 8-P phosphatase)